MKTWLIISVTWLGFLGLLWSIWPADGAQLPFTVERSEHGVMQACRGELENAASRYQAQRIEVARQSPVYHAADGAALVVLLVTIHYAREQRQAVIDCRVEPDGRVSVFETARAP